MSAGRLRLRQAMTARRSSTRHSHTQRSIGRDTAIDWLLDHGADVDWRPYLNVTPLHFAVQFGRASTVQVLLARAADREIRDDIRGGTPLGWAVYQGPDQIARFSTPPEETITDTGLAYRSGEPVRLRVTRRERRLTVSDAGAWRSLRPGGRRAGEPSPGGSSANSTSTSPAPAPVWLPVVAAGPPLHAIEQRIAHASLTFYQELLELASD